MEIFTIRRHPLENQVIRCSFKLRAPLPKSLPAEGGPGRSSHAGIPLQYTTEATGTLTLPLKVANPEMTRVCPAPRETGQRPTETPRNTREQRCGAFSRVSGRFWRTLADSALFCAFLAFLGVSGICLSMAGLKLCALQAPQARAGAGLAAEGRPPTVSPLVSLPGDVCDDN